MITYGDLAPLTIQQTAYGFYAYNANEFDGPESTWGHGDTPEAAVENYYDKVQE